MRGRSLEEIDELFQRKVPTKDFASYHCVSGERAREQALESIKLARQKGYVKENEAVVEKREVAA